MAIETLGAALRQINRLFSGGTVTGISDAQLLERFVSRHDDAAFEALVARHGPMVLSVCRGVLHDPNDAEDAFQATFLVLVKKAGTFRGHVALAGWLYLVAYRVAIRANVAASRRRAYERQAGQMAAARSASGPEVEDERLRALHEEIARLPEKLRLAILLCDLQGVTQDQAAGQLRLSERTLRRRLGEGRERLKARLARRGPASDEATLGALLLREAGTVVPPAWRETAVRAALAYSESMVATGVVSAAAATLSREVLKTMMLQKLKLASAALLGAALMTWGASAALVSRGAEPPKVVPAAVAPRPAQVPSPQPEPDPLDAVGTFLVRGRVLDPDGKPFAGAEIYARHEIDWDRPMNDFATRRQPSRMTTSGADGRFRFELDKAASDNPFGDDPAWHNAQVAAVSRGLGPAWINVEALFSEGEATLRLVRDVPIRGRVLDSQGRPATGRSGTTDPAFRITVPPGEGVIRANARGSVTPYTHAHLRPADKEKLGGEEEFARHYANNHAYRVVDVPAAAESFTADLELTRGLTREGKVVGPDGQPVIGARCYGVRPTWGHIKTLADDAFEILGLEPGRPRLVIFAHQARRLVGSVVINDDNLKTDAPLVVRLVPAGSIKGRLVDEDGLPLAGARLGVLTYDLDGINLPPGANHGGSYCLWPDGEIFVSDADGRFLVDGLKPGVRSSLNIENTVRPVLYLSINDLLRNTDIKPGEIRDVGDVKVKPKAE